MANSLRQIRAVALDIDGVLLSDTFSPIIKSLVEFFDGAYSREVERNVFSQNQKEASNISVIFEESKVQPEQYIFVKDSLNKFKLYINSEYSFKSELKYDESSQRLSIGINIIIPAHFIPNDPDKANEILMDPVNTFQIFYDAQNQIYHRKHGNI